MLALEEIHWGDCLDEARQEAARMEQQIREGMERANQELIRVLQRRQPQVI